MTTEQVLTIRAGLISILRASVDAAMAFRLGRIHKKLTEEAGEFQEAQKGLFEKLAVNGQVPPAHRAEFDRQNRELLAVESLVEIKPIPFSELTAAVSDPDHTIPGEAWVQIEPIISGIPDA